MPRFIKNLGKTPIDRMRINIQSLSKSTESNYNFFLFFF